ncbi:MAG: cytochrome c oxidase subunit 3 [Acidobacteriota bacterium]|nr:cytochrome c oxidase subunit 3 [Acidobacteriota bacterium]
MDSSVLTPVREEKQPGNGGRGGDGGGSDGFGGGGNGGSPGGEFAPVDVSVTGIWIAIIAIVMLFAALTSVWVIRKGMAREWVPTALPGIIYVNSVILLVSSLTLEFARGSLSSGLPHRFLAWLYITLALGIAFIAGQLVAWRDLVHHGIYLATDPSSSFFYLLTATHGVHLVGGVVALSFASIQGPAIARGMRSRKLVDVTAIYWHFMYVLWIYILLLLVLKV